MARGPREHDPDWIWLREVARRIGVSIETARRWAREGRLPAPVPLGRDMRWRRAVIEAWLEGQGITEGATRAAAD